MIIGVIACESEGQEIVIRRVNNGTIAIIIGDEAANITLYTLGKTLGLLLDKKSVNYFVKCIENAKKLKV